MEETIPFERRSGVIPRFTVQEFEALPPSFQAALCAAEERRQAEITAGDLNAAGRAGGHLAALTLTYRAWLRRYYALGALKTYQVHTRRCR